MDLKGEGGGAFVVMILQDLLVKNKDNNGNPKNRNQQAEN
jgi:hypothetical protein